MHKTIKLGTYSMNSAKKFWLSDSSAYSIEFFVSGRRFIVSKYLKNINFGPEINFFATKKTLRICLTLFFANCSGDQVFITCNK